MCKNKIYDCITFFDENLLVNARFEILKDVVDFFIVCESKYDHRGKEKELNFKPDYTFEQGIKETMEWYENL